MGTPPILGITMGDPAGIGPEIAIKAFDDPELYKVSRPLILGDPNCLAQYKPLGVTLKEIEGPGEASGRPGIVEVLAVSRLDPVLLRPARPSIEGGKAMITAVTRGIDLALRGEIHGLVTGPISKVLMQRAGYSYEGHTELLADLTRAPDYAMMLAGENLRVVLATVHCPLSLVPVRLKREGILRILALVHRSLLADFAVDDPVIGVAALNPHAGEDGLFGDEEKRVIAPAVADARALGIDAVGPLPADTIFHKAVSGEFDAVLCMYHDQGLIPLKLLHFSDGVNITLGLPIVRTSVDHGTAYDIAGKGLADPSSLKAAVRAASTIASNRAKARGGKTP